MVYPNPVADRVNIRIGVISAAQATILIFDLRGQVISSQPIRLINGENQFEIDLTGRAKGMYIIKIQGIDGLPAYSILKELCAITMLTTATIFPSRAPETDAPAVSTP